MNLNKKGYMLVEIIIASVLAMSIAYYLLNLTYKFKNTNEDLYQNYHYMSDKILITKNIMNDLESGTISNIAYDTNSISFLLHISNEKSEITQLRKLLVNKENDKTTIQYGLYNSESNSFYKTDLSYYEKKLNHSLIIDNLIVKGYDDYNINSVTIEIPIKSIYSDVSYTIKLFANKQ